MLSFEGMQYRDDSKFSTPDEIEEHQNQSDLARLTMSGENLANGSALLICLLFREGDQWFAEVQLST